MFFCNYVRKLKFRTFSCPFREMVSEFLVHFMKWAANLTISQNGQVSHPFHKMVNFAVHFMKWTISHLGHNIYIILLHTIFKRMTCVCGTLKAFCYVILVNSYKTFWKLQAKNTVNWGILNSVILFTNEVDDNDNVFDTIQNMCKYFKKYEASLQLTIFVDVGNNAIFVDLRHVMYKVADIDTTGIENLIQIRQVQHTCQSLERKLKNDYHHQPMSATH